MLQATGLSQYCGAILYFEFIKVFSKSSLTASLKLLGIGGT